MYLTFAWRYFKAKKSAHAINIIAWVTTGVIAFATCCQILVLSVFNGFEDLVRSLYSSFYTDLKIVPEKGKTFLLDPERIARLRNHPLLAGMCMITEEKALLNNENGQLVVTLKGVDGDFIKVSGVPASVFNGKFETGSAEEPKAVLGSGIQYASGAFVDKAFSLPRLTVILPRAHMQSTDPLNLLSEGYLEVAGAFSIQQEFDNNYVITGIDFVRNQMNLQKNEYTAAEIKLKSGADLTEMKKEILRLLGTGYKVETKYEQNQSLYNTMRLEKWAIFAILTLILIIAAFNMISALTMLVLEKRSDIQILQSMGASTSRIRKIFLFEGLLLGGLGALAGMTLALIICLLQLKFKFISLKQGAFLIDHFPVKMLLTDFLLVAASSASIALLASWLPAGKASRQIFMLR